MKKQQWLQMFAIICYKFFEALSAKMPSDINISKGLNQTVRLTSEKKNIKIRRNVVVLSEIVPVYECVRLS